MNAESTQSRVRAERVLKTQNRRFVQFFTTHGPFLASSLTPHTVVNHSSVLVFLTKNRLSDEMPEKEIST